jgi:nucleotide-binding universal stress UspA family protein
LIVIGQRQRSAVGTSLLGSVAREVLDSVHRPVLLVGPSTPGAYPRR